MSHRRFAESYYRSTRAKFGNRRIHQELRTRGLSEEEIRQYLPALDESSERVDAAVAILRKKYPSASFANEKDRARAIRFLTARGFHHASIARAIDALRQSGE